VSSGANKWTKEEKNNILKQVYDAEKWLQQQAAKWNVTVRYQGGTFGLEKDIVLSNLQFGAGRNNEKTTYVSEVLKKVGYKSPLDFSNWAQNTAKCKNSLVLIFAKGSGTGYSMAYQSNAMNKELYYVEGSILYEKYSDGQYLATASIAHEILHLFGAWDFYETFKQSKKNENKAKQLFPNSVMLRVSYNINSLMIDEITAWLIGWNKNPKSWYDSLNPFTNCKAL
jgi:hypothetical protein